MTDETALVLRPDEDGIALGTLRAGTAEGVLAAAAAIAKPLAKLIEDQKLYTIIGDKRHVEVEGWTSLAAMCGLMPREVATVADKEGTYTSTVELVRMRDGVVISRASGECGVDEPTWKNRPHYARRSMAATRATSKACRLALSWVMVMAGYAPTPASEMPTAGAEKGGRLPKPQGFVLPGKADRWDGWAGKPLMDVPEKTLRGALAWFQKKDDARNLPLMEAIELELDARTGGGEEPQGTEG